MEVFSRVLEALDKASKDRSEPESNQIVTLALSIHNLGKAVPEMRGIVVKSCETAYLALSMQPDRREELQRRLSDIETFLSNAQSRGSRVSKLLGRWLDGRQLKKHTKFLHNFIVQDLARQYPRNGVPQPSLRSLSDWTSDIDNQTLDSTTHEASPFHSSSESTSLDSYDRCPSPIPIIFVTPPLDSDSDSDTSIRRDNKGRLPLTALLKDCSNEQAKELADVVQSEIQTAGSVGYRRECTRHLRRLFEKYRVLPSSLFVNDVARPEGNNHPACGGGFSDIYKGISGGKDVCLKVLRLFPSDDSARKEKTVNELCKEALIWTQFDHPNVLPFLGVNNELFPLHGFCMVSPWMENGGIISFLQKNTGHDRLVVCREIAAGLTYLHSRKVAHGDIKPPNILVDEAGHCRLADFGLATTVHEASSSFNPTTATGSQKGTLRYMAPEIILMSDDSASLVPNGRTSKIDKFAADVYAYACTLLEIMTCKPPFPTLNDAAVMLRVATLNIRPDRPTEAGVWCPDNVWGLIEKCWDRKPKQRPMAKNILSFLEHIEELRCCGEPWDQIDYWGS